MSEKMKLELNPINIKTMKIPIRGRTPLLVNKISDKVRNEIQAKRTGLKMKVKEKVNPTKDYETKHHKLSDGSFGFPASGFQGAMVELAKSRDIDLGISGKFIKGAVQIYPEDDSGNLKLEYKEMKSNTSSGRDSSRNRTPIEITRPMFVGWKCILPVQFDGNVINQEQIINLINYAGWHIGVGAWRPQNMGTYGRFEVDIERMNKMSDTEK